jgi:hypothetical protein
MYLRDRVAALYSAIRRRAISQYLSPYVSVDLKAMSTAFAVP